MPADSTRISTGRVRHKLSSVWVMRRQLTIFWIIGPEMLTSVPALPTTLRLSKYFLKRAERVNARAGPASHAEETEKFVQRGLRLLAPNEWPTFL
jgi:hypothetical protein